MRTKYLLLFTLSPILACGLTGCDSGYSNNHVSYEEARLTLEQQEQLNPTSFLTADGTYRRN